jgi:hypothetical protein
MSFSRSFVSIGIPVGYSKYIMLSGFAPKKKLHPSPLGKPGAALILNRDYYGRQAP